MKISVAMRQRRERVEHLTGPIKARMGAARLPVNTLRVSPPRWRCTCSPTLHSS